VTAPALAVQQNGLLQVSGDNYNTYEQSCNVVADLKGFIGVSGVQVYMRGYTAVGDGGQGQFYWNAGAVSPVDDGGVTTIVPNGAASGCWTRIIDAVSSSLPVAADGRNILVSDLTNTTAAATYDQFVVKASLTGKAYLLSSGNITFNGATTGAGGMDTGALPTSGFVYLYVIYNPTTSIASVIGTTLSSNTIYSSSHMPAGYTANALIGVLLTDGSAHLLGTQQYGREVFLGSAVSIFTNATNVSALTSQSVAAAVPSIAKMCSGFLTVALVGSVTNVANVAGNASGFGQQTGPMLTSSTVTNLTSQTCNFRNLPIVTAQAIYWNTGNTGGSTNSMGITSFTF